jgi:hypothetical protein
MDRPARFLTFDLSFAIGHLLLAPAFLEDPQRKPRSDGRAQLLTAAKIVSTDYFRTKNRLGCLRMRADDERFGSRLQPPACNDAICCAAFWVGGQRSEVRDRKSEIRANSR